MSRDNDPEFIKWAKEVKIRDNFTCQICEARGVYLESHHKNSWDTFINDRYYIENGITLCGKCHNNYHNLMGYGNNTEFQFSQYEEIVKTFRKLLAKTAETLEIEEKNR